MLAQILLFALGLCGLIYGAQWLVTGSAGIARGAGISQLVIGLTVVAVGTSTPEMAVSVLAALKGSTDVAIGNVIGSNIANLGLVLGATALIRAVPVTRATLAGDIPVMIGAAVAVVVFARDGSIGQFDGLLLLASAATYLGVLLRYELSHPEVASEEIEVFDPAEERAPPSRLKDSGRILAGLTALVLGAQLLIGAAIYLARTFGVSDLVIGLTVVAVGTSLPEMATSVMAALRGHADLALGNVIGSNILNILLILGLTAVIHPLPAQPSMLAFEIPVMLGISVALLPLALRRRRIMRGEAVVLVTGYLVFLVILFRKGGL